MEPREQPENLCHFTTEFLAQMEKISVRSLAVVLKLRNHRLGNAPLSREELEAIIEECSTGEGEIQSLWEAFEAHRVQHGCRDLFVEVPEDDPK